MADAIRDNPWIVITPSETVIDGNKFHPTTIMVDIDGELVRITDLVELYKRRA